MNQNNQKPKKTQDQEESKQQNEREAEELSKQHKPRRFQGDDGQSSRDAGAAFEQMEKKN